MKLKDKFEINREFIHKFNKIQVVPPSIIKAYIEENKLDEAEWKFIENKGYELLHNESLFLSKTENEYVFFKNLRRQTKYDNVISLIKICNRLDLPFDINLNVEDIDYDDIWKQINNNIDQHNSLLAFNYMYDMIFKDIYIFYEVY